MRDGAPRPRSNGSRSAAILSSSCAAAFPPRGFEAVPRRRLALAAQRPNLRPAEVRGAATLMLPPPSEQRRRRRGRRRGGGSDRSEVTPRRLTHLVSPAAMGTAVAGAVWDWRARLARSACPSLPPTGSSATLAVERLPVEPQRGLLRMRQRFLICELTNWSFYLQK